MNILPLLMAVLSGVAMAVQGALNTDLSKTIGLLAGTFFVHIVGTIFAVILLFFRLSETHWNAITSVPWYNFLGGIIGVGIVYGVIFSMTKLGAAATTTAIIIGQISMAAIIDKFGLFGLESIPFNLWKGLGIILMALSGWLLLHK